MVPALGIFQTSHESNYYIAFIYISPDNSIIEDDSGGSDDILDISMMYTFSSALFSQTLLAQVCKIIKN